MRPNTPDTQELLEHVKLGESAAINKLLAQHREPIRRMIQLRLDPAVVARVDASDVVQDVMLEASRRLRDYVKDPAMPFHLWLRHIAQDHIVDAHRRHHRAKRRTVDRERPMHAAAADKSSIRMMHDLIDRELTPASAAIRRELAKRFQGALELLNQDDREIILMRHFEQLSNQDVAAALKLSGAAASMRYLRALRRLREALVPENQGSRDT